MAKGSIAENTCNELCNIDVLGILAIEEFGLRAYCIDRHVCVGVLGIGRAGMRGPDIAILAVLALDDTTGLMVSGDHKRGAGMAQNELHGICDGFIIARHSMNDLGNTNVVCMLINVTLFDHGKEGVIALNARISNFDEVKNIIDYFGIYVYDATGSTVKTIAEASDKEMLEKNNGEYHMLISDIAESDFSTKVLALPFVVIGEDLVMGDPITVSVSDINKWLGAK